MSDSVSRAQHVTQAMPRGPDETATDVAVTRAPTTRGAGMAGATASSALGAAMVEAAVSSAQGADATATPASSAAAEAVAAALAHKDHHAVEAIQRVRDSFARQTIMTLFDARLARVEPGLVEIALPFRPDLCQQNGYLHAGISTTIADSAGGYAALSLFDAGEDVLTSEFKMNFLAPAEGTYFVATGRVLKPGRRLSICQVEVHAHRGNQSTLCVVGLMTAVRVVPR